MIIMDPLAFITFIIEIAFCTAYDRERTWDVVKNLEDIDLASRFWTFAVAACEY